jgi:hypothetical protein
MVTNQPAGCEPSPDPAVEQGLCVQQCPQLLTESALSACAADADRNPVPAWLRRGCRHVRGAGTCIALGLAAPVSDPGRDQFVADDGMHRILLGDETG